MRLIDADALLHNVRRAFYPSDLATRIAVGCVNGMPTVDAEPVRHGHWIIDTKFGNDVMSGSTMVICSECGHGTMSGMSQYCPNCGARMDGENDDADK